MRSLLKIKAYISMPVIWSTNSVVGHLQQALPEHYMKLLHKSTGESK